MEISRSSLLATAFVAAFSVLGAAARALAFAPIAVFAAGRDVGAGGALFEALIETDRRADEIEGGAEPIFEKALIAEVQRFQLIRKKNERRRRDRSLRDVENLHFAICGRCAALEIDVRKPAIQFAG
jgi:hypothetical protein